jgi:hypothetical protein
LLDELLSTVRDQIDFIQPAQQALFGNKAGEALPEIPPSVLLPGSNSAVPIPAGSQIYNPVSSSSVRQQLFSPAAQPL